MGSPHELPGSGLGPDGPVCPVVWYTGLMVREWQPFNGMNIYYNWRIGAPDVSVPKLCYTGLLHHNISCPAPPPAVKPDQPAEVSKICVDNGAGFVLNWVAKNVRTGTASASSGDYPIGKTRCMDLGSIAGVQEGDKVQASVHAILGKTNDVSTEMIYKKNSRSATFKCTGTTLNFKCGLA